MLFELSSVHKY